MVHRYCPECDEWYETADYTVDDSGETVCKVDGHGAVHGYIDGGTARFEVARYGDAEVDAAIRQGLL